MIRILCIGVRFCKIYVTESMFIGIFIQIIRKMLFAIKYTAIWSGILYKNDMDFAVILWYNNYLTDRSVPIYHISVRVRGYHEN